VPIAFEPHANYRALMDPTREPTRIHESLLGRIALSRDELLYRLAASMLGLARIPKALRWLALPLALGLTHIAFEPSAHAASTKKAKKSKKKQPTGGSMDDNAGKDTDVGGTAPGTTDSKTAAPEEAPPEEPKKPKPGETPAENVKLEEVDDTPAEVKEEGPPSPFSLNWLSISVQQNLLIYGDVKGVCPSIDDNGVEHDGAAGYSCRDASGAHRGAVYAGGGNEVHGGVGLADLRFLIGYDRVLGQNITLGARVGIAILQSPAVTGTQAPMPVHGEARFGYYFGESPFMNKGFRPYVLGAVGFAEIDGKVSVTYYKDHVGYQNGQAGTLDVWRKTGPWFVAANAGLSYPFGDFAVNLDLRMAFLFPYIGFAPAATLGLGYGF
jgi:hypothetical protein